MLVAQSYLTFSDCMICSPPGSSVIEFSQQEYWSGEWHRMLFLSFQPDSLATESVKSSLCKINLKWSLNDLWMPPYSMSLFSTACCAKSLQSYSTSLWPCGPSPARLFCPWDFPGKSTGVSCHPLLQESSRSKDLTRISYVSCIGRWVLYH